MSKISGVHHIAIRAVDFDRSVGFYTQTLGLGLKASWSNGERRAAMIEVGPGSYSACAPMTSSP